MRGKKIQSLDLTNQVKLVQLDTLTTTNYGKDIYQSLPFNRTLKRANILKLIKAFKIVNPKHVSMLTVIETSAFTGKPEKFLCDGHNRREAALELASLTSSPVELSIKIVKIDGEDTREAVGKVLETINVNLGTWNPNDYGSHISKLNPEKYSDYLQFEKLVEEYKDIRMTHSAMLQILGLGVYSMEQYKRKEFKFAGLEKSLLILNLIKEIGVNDSKKGKTDGFPETHIKRALIKRLISLDTKQLSTAKTKFQKFLKTTQFSYNEAMFSTQIEIILS